ncbi:hypothetical protein HU200_032935 [Digitaria exilis]|uniref:Uncharacterized protein n=1 Tax=Digitaria exilis TaxID=1010633 RepID=A0A835ELA8_9POAL|nr:hypothetical protein HU200_032935 [Digitaria exilis]CAB3488011.1 unnamed protein product [Digitaria exilis]
MSRGAMSSGGGRSSLGYLFEPEETALYHTAAKSNHETEKIADTNSIGVKDDDKTTIGGAEADQEPPQLPPQKREASNPILSCNIPPCNIYRTSKSSCNSGLLITDRPSTRVRCAPGGPSSLGFLFGEEHEK